MIYDFNSSFVLVLVVLKRQRTKDTLASIQPLSALSTLAASNPHQDGHPIVCELVVKW